MARHKTRFRRQKLMEDAEKKKQHMKTRKKSSKKTNKVEGHREREKRLEKKRESERARRRKIKEDPMLYNDYLRKEKERAWKRKEANKIKLVSQLTEREKRIRRKDQNERKRKSRLQQKNNHNSDATPKEKKTNRVANKKKNITLMQKTIAELTEKNKKVVRSLKKLSKRIERSKQGNDISASPRSAVRKFLKGRIVQHDVKQRLISSEVLIHQLKESYNDKNSYKTKQILGRIFCRKIIKKYRKIAFIKKHIAALYSSKNIPVAEHALTYCRRPNSSHLFMKNKVQKFFEENSRIDPSKKACKSINNQKISKRYMDASIIDLYAKFSKENSLRLSYSTFAKLRPAYCVAPKVSNRDTCACLIHENVSLLIVALFNTNVVRENSLEKVLGSILCDNRSEDCLRSTCCACQKKEVQFSCEIGQHEQEISYEKWQTSTEDRVNEKTKNPISVKLTAKKKITCTIERAIKIFKEEMEKFMGHEYRRVRQKSYLEKLIANVSCEELIVLIDFSENYTCKYGTEVHSVHFGASRAQCTLHTGMLYTSAHSQGFATLSESLRHDPGAIIAHVGKILDIYLPKMHTVKTIHFISDGPTTQYRNRKMFNLITQYLPHCYSQLSSISYNFTEAGHGKSPADGIGGSLKKQADDQVKYGLDIPDFQTFVETLRSRVKNIYLDVVTKDDIEIVDSKLPQEIPTFVGTMKVHQYTWSKQKPNIVFFNSLSCSECEIGTECEHYFMGNLLFNSAAQKSSKIRAPRKTKSAYEDNIIHCSSKMQRRNHQPSTKKSKTEVSKIHNKDISILKNMPHKKSLRAQKCNND